MTIRIVTFVAISLFAASLSFGQDPTKVAPDAYKLRFENEWVKVMAVHYGAHAKVPVHDHSQWPAAYVYLNNAGPVIFSHTDWEHPVLTRPPVRARSFRLSPTTAVGETHQAWNPGDTASDFLRIEFKTEAPGRALLRGRFPAAKYNAAREFSRKEFENKQLRITRLAVPANRRLTVAASTQPVLVVVLSPVSKAGETIWLAAGASRVIEKSPTGPLEVLRFDFLTAPGKPGSN